MGSISHDQMRSSNKLAILECIRRNGPVTKRDIQHTTGLSWGAVSMLTNELFDKGLITGAGMEKTAVGRTPSRYDINSNTNLAVGIDINITGLRAVIMDIKGRQLRQYTVPLRSLERERVIAQTTELAARACSEAGEGNVLGVGVAMMGTIDQEHGISLYSPYFNNWHDVPLSRILSEAVFTDVLLEHDPDCMAYAERQLTAQESRDMLFIRVGAGVGLSVITNGKAHSGKGGMAIELGHTQVVPGGRECVCGRKGCLEAYASMHAVAQRARQGEKRGYIVGLSDDELFSAVVAEAGQGDAFALSLLAEAADFMGIAVGNLINILNPELVVIGGELPTSWPEFVDRAEQRAREIVWQPCATVVTSAHINEYGAAAGAAFMVVARVFSGLMDII